MLNFDSHRRLSTVEREINKLKDGYQELDGFIDPKGWIGESFELLDKNVEEVKKEITQLRQEVNGKLDAILQYLTGMNKNSVTTEILSGGQNFRYLIVFNKCLICPPYVFDNYLFSYGGKIDN